MTACIETFPPLEWLGRFYEESQMWGDGAIPRWFEDWLNAEREATTLRIWQPLLVPGLLQTAYYARALFLGGLLNPTEDAIDQLVAARLARQSIFDRPDPSNLSPRPWTPGRRPPIRRRRRSRRGHPRHRSKIAAHVDDDRRGRPQQQRQERVCNPSSPRRCAC